MIRGALKGHEGLVTKQLFHVRRNDRNLSCIIIATTTSLGFTKLGNILNYRVDIATANKAKSNQTFRLYVINDPIAYKPYWGHLMTLSACIPKKS